MCLAVPGRIVSIAERDDTLMAEVDFGGVLKSVCLEYMPQAKVDDYVLVHVGFAIQRVDEESALETLRTIKQTGDFEAEFGDHFRAAARQAGVDIGGDAPGSGPSDAAKEALR
jgi:hydrogenase expression/formation protein HypC